VTVDTIVLSKALTALLGGDRTDGYMPFYGDGLYLDSYALDPSNPYYYPLNDPKGTNSDLSGYFDQVSAAYACAV
jgi:hypothetical protein